MEHYGKMFLCPSKYYIGDSLLNESALEIWIFGNSVFVCCCFFTRGGHHFLSSTQQLCPVEAKILACTHLQIQALTSAAIFTSTTSDAKTTDVNNLAAGEKRTGILDGKNATTKRKGLFYLES